MNKKYWLRGGIALLVIFIIFLLLAIYLDTKFGGHPGFITVPLFSAIYLWGVFNADLSGAGFWATAIPLSGAFWFLVGSLVGCMRK